MVPDVLVYGYDIMEGEICMMEKVIMMYDAKVYRLLEDQAKFNRKAVIFSLAMIAYLVTKEIQIRNMANEIKRLNGEKGD